MSRLRVYDWEGPDGLRGGSPHVHLVCSEAYLVLGGSGAVQTLGPSGFNETPVERGSLLWFTPGLVHRLINHDQLEIVVLMQIATLPEAGDCILSFPEPVLADREAYLEAAGHDPGRSVAAVDDEAARRRRDLAVVGFNELRERVEREGEGALQRFYELAAGIAAPLLGAWREAWETGSSATANRAGELIEALERGGVPPLAASMFGLEPPSREVLGLCGRLDVYPSVDGVPVVYSSGP
ncbi:MAG TPA: cupin domain-containing protein [Solirubrobacter sp.]|nr:cupin domain-containing protein [Solirubrobacter sp.]